MTAAARQRAYRERRARGAIVIRLEIDEVAAVERLISAGFLAEQDRDDRDALEAAVAQVNSLWFAGDDK